MPKTEKSTLQTALHAFAQWVQDHDVDIKDVNLLIRCKDEKTRARLDLALARWRHELTQNNIIFLTPPTFQYHGIKISISM